MNEILKYSYERKAHDAVEVLNRCKFDAHYADNAAEAKEIVKSLIPKGSEIAVGGSVTLQETGIMDLIRSDDYKFIDRFNNKSWDEELHKYRLGYMSDVFITSSNAVTMEGQLVNIDCTGNRTGCIGFGPKKVIIVIGVNKIVADAAEGVKRAKSIAPLNSRRINHGNPCDETLSCENCTGTNRVCNIISIIDGCYKFPGRISVIVVAEELGF
ncbi:MAG: lactate utilization protein [bacterium]|nr:lactate utilization protein [bacterium]